MSQFADNQWFETEHCCNCGMAFAMTKEFRDRKLKDRASFYCPAGHPQHYTGKSEEQKLKDELQRKEQMLDAAQARANEASIERDQITRMHKKMRSRVMNGVCPCCNRTFQNLMNHMKSEHPDFNEIKTLSVLRNAFGMSQTAVAKEAGVIPAYVSSYEHEKYVPPYAKRALDAWVDRHTEKSK